MNKLFGVFTSSIRRLILSSFAVIILLVVAMAMAGYLQLEQARSASQQIVPNSSQMASLQDLGLSISALDANLERFFVLGGVQFQEEILQNLQDMSDALDSMKQASGANAGPALADLERTTTGLRAEVIGLLQADSSNLSSREINERILAVYGRIDTVKQLHQALTEETLARLRDMGQRQESITTNVITQFMILGIAVSVIAIAASLFATRSIATPLTRLAEIASQIAGGDLAQTAEVNRRDEIGVLAQAFNKMTAQLRALIGGLEQRVAERTAELERRSRYLEATAEVARSAASVLRLEEILAQTANLISDRFGFYHTGLFLLDTSREWAVLQAASSEGGQRMLARNHRLRVGQTGLVGYVTRSGEPRIALDAGADAVHFDNPDLPDTRSEMTLPLRAHGEIIGALDVQSTEPAAFTDEDVTVLQTLADQVALAISNARLFQQAQESLAAERRAYGRLSHEAWLQAVRSRPNLGFLCDSAGRLRPSPTSWQSAMVRASQTGHIVQEDGSTLAIPVKVRENVEGVVRLRKPDEAGEWTPAETELMESLVEQLGLALDSARLYQDTQRRAVREQVVSQVSARMRESLDLETMLKTATSEMRQALGLENMLIRLTIPDAGSAATEGNGRNSAEMGSVESE